MQVGIITAELAALFELVEEMATKVNDNRAFGLVPNPVRVFPAERVVMRSERQRPKLRVTKIQWFGAAPAIQQI